MKSVLEKYKQEDALIVWAVYSLDFFHVGKVLDIIESPDGDCVQLSYLDDDWQVGGTPWLRIEEVWYVDPNSTEANREKLNNMFHRTMNVEE